MFFKASQSLALGISKPLLPEDGKLVAAVPNEETRKELEPLIDQLQSAVESVDVFKGHKVVVEARPDMFLNPKQAAEKQLEAAIKGNPVIRALHEELTLIPVVPDQ